MVSGKTTLYMKDVLTEVAVEQSNNYLIKNTSASNAKRQ